MVILRSLANDSIDLTFFCGLHVELSIMISLFALPYR